MDGLVHSIREQELFRLHSKKLSQCYLHRFSFWISRQLFASQFAQALHHAGRCSHGVFIEVQPQPKTIPERGPILSQVLNRSPRSKHWRTSSAPIGRVPLILQPPPVFREREQSRAALFWSAAAR